MHLWYQDDFIVDGEISDRTLYKRSLKNWTFGRPKASIVLPQEHSFRPKVQLFSDPLYKVLCIQSERKRVF